MDGENASSQVPGHRHVGAQRRPGMVGADHRRAARTSPSSSGRSAGPLRSARILAAAGLFAGGLVGANAGLLAGAPAAGAR